MVAVGEGGRCESGKVFVFSKMVEVRYACVLVEQSNRDQPTKQPLKKQKHKTDATGERGALLG